LANTNAACECPLVLFSGFFMHVTVIPPVFGGLTLPNQKNKQKNGQSATANRQALLAKPVRQDPSIARQVSTFVRKLRLASIHASRYFSRKA